MTYGSKQFPCRFQMLVFAQAIPDYVLQVLTQLLVIYSQQEIDDVIRQDPFIGMKSQIRHHFGMQQLDMSWI